MEKKKKTTNLLSDIMSSLRFISCQTLTIPKFICSIVTSKQFNMNVGSEFAT